MKVLFFIHGGEAFLSEWVYQDFLRDTYVWWQSEPWTPEEKTSWTKEIAKIWHGNWGTVLMPVFPNKLNARYEEWKIVFDGILKTLPEDAELTFIGWSLGGCFLLKYFSERDTFRFTINTIHLMAACMSEGDFTAPWNFRLLQTYGEKVHIWHAEDDTVVPFETGKQLSILLPDAQTHFFWSEKWYRHFHGVERIPELESLLK